MPEKASISLGHHRVGPCAFVRLMHRFDNPPEDWAAIVAFADGPRTTFEEVRKHRPPKEKVRKALNDYLERIKIANCRINHGYLKALGLR